jgi:sigma-B regulation protein RsbU (phosphoserine phosphatase)
MRQDLRHHIEELKQTTAIKERIESEIQIARSIQMSLVPKTFPPFPDRDEISLFAILEPAREIGGDLYDFYMADENHICMVVGDVTGKGVPAALFMAVTRTFLKSIWREEIDPALTLQRLNNSLAEDNDTDMFVTLFCGVLDLRTGKYRYARGGHNPPLWIQKDKPIARVPWINGVLVGVIPESTFEEAEITLKPGDRVFMFTDGVTEANNPAHDEYGEERLLETLEKCREQSNNEMIAAVRDSIRTFAEGTEQSDDITMLCFEFRGYMTT